MRTARPAAIALLLLAAPLLLGLVPAPPAAAGAGEDAAGRPAGPRLVSLNPSLTAILLALDAGRLLVGVDAWSHRRHPELEALPAVGGLYNPSLEALVALDPDLVVFVPSAEQRDFQARLAELGIAVRAFDPVRFDEVLGSIRALGRIAGREAAAEARVAAIRRTRARLAARAAGRRSPRTVLVIQRDPLFVVGGGNFIHEMLASVGARNVAAAREEPYPRVSLEWLVDRAPEVILDASRDAEPAADYWARWPSLPAVAAARVVALEPEVATLPGPHLDRALRVLARAVHGRGILADAGEGDAGDRP